MSDSSRAENLLTQLDHLNAQQLRRLLVEHLTKLKLGLYWEANAIERDAALNADLVLPRLVEEWSHAPSPLDPLPPGERVVLHIATSSVQILCASNLPLAGWRRIATA